MLLPFRSSQPNFNSLSGSVDVPGAGKDPAVPVLLSRAGTSFPEGLERWKTKIKLHHRPGWGGKRLRSSPGNVCDPRGSRLGTRGGSGGSA